jgi:hypothetical protein
VEELETVKVEVIALQKYVGEIVAALVLDEVELPRAYFLGCCGRKGKALACAA